MCCMAQESSEEESNEEKEVMVEKNAQVVAKKKFEEINLGTNSHKPRPISINSRLSEKEKS